MYVCHRIGPRISSNWNTIEEIVDSTGPISFDGCYTEVYDHYRALKGKDVTFFVTGKYVGANNDFDLHSGEKPGRFCTWPQIEEMAAYLGAKIGWHGWAHKKCVGLSYPELDAELTCAFTRILAWAHGVADAGAISVAEDLGYEEAFCAGPHGDDSQFQRRRQYLNW